jgi:TonB family protein
MAPMSTQTGSSLDGRDRRICARQQVKSLAYLDIGSDNGGIVLNISESGVAVHAVSVLPAEPLVDLRLQLPRSSKRLETKGKVAWTSSTKKEAGVEFIELPEEVRLEIRDWLASENLEPVYIESSPDIESSARPPARRDKWTNLVSELSSIPAGIDRVTDDRMTSTRPVSVPESLSNETTVAPSLPDLNAIATSQETVFAAPARDFGLTESLTAESLRPDSLIADQQNAQSSESNSIAAPELTDHLSSNPDPIRDQQYRKGDLELTLPSDKLLNTSLHPIAIVPSRGNKIDNAKPSRNLRDSDSGASDGDAFLRKARALFGPKHLEAQQPEIPEIDDSASPLESVEPAPAALPVEAVAEQAPAPMSDLIATSTPASEPFIPSTLRPVTSIPLDPSASHGTEAKRRSTSLPATRGLDLRSFLSILALCVLLSVVCLAFGIVVGRGVATRSTNAMANRDEVAARSTQGTAAQGQDGSISNRADTSASLSQGHNQLQRRTSAQRPHEATSHRRLPVQQTDDISSASLAGETDAPADNAAVAAVAGIAQGSAKSTVTPPSAAATSTTGASTAPAPTPAAASVAAPRSQPPSDRMVAAYLIYRVEPIYPRAALHAGVEGTVKIHATVGRDGAVKNLKVVSGPDLLAPAAIEAAQYWRYIPALRNGEPVETDADISVEFHLPH